MTPRARPQPTATPQPSTPEAKYYLGSGLWGSVPSTVHSSRHMRVKKIPARRVGDLVSLIAVLVSARKVMANSMANLLDLPHALLEHISTELTLPGVGRYASVCSLLRQLIAANTAPCWRIHLQACTGNVASDQPRLALRALTTLDAARWADISPRFAESEDPDAHIARLDFDEGQPTSQVAHAAFTCNDGKTLVIVGVKRHSIVLTAWAIDTTTPAARWQEAPCSEQARGMGVLERSRLRVPLQKPYNLAPNPSLTRALTQTLTLALTLAEPARRAPLQCGRRRRRRAPRQGGA